MRSMTKSTPITLVGLLAGGAVLFGLNAFFSVPVETWFAIVGIIIFVAGLLFGLYGSFQSIAILSSAESRRATGLVVPILTVVLAGGAWLVVVTTAIAVKRSLDQRAQSEQNHWDEIHGNNKKTDQPTSASDVTTRAAPEK